MPFQLGDILLNVDTRSTAGTMSTRHHVMLVLGQTQQGYPQVVHMKAAPRWGLVNEELKRGKELILIRCPWPKETAQMIQEAAQIALASNKFAINPDIIQEQLNSVSTYRPLSGLQTHLMLRKLLEAYVLDSKKPSGFKPNPEKTYTISCHEWVISIIHYACRQTQTPIPLTFQIPPHLAWADRILALSNDDRLISRHIVTLTDLSIEQREDIQPQRRFKMTAALSAYAAMMTCPVCFFSSKSSALDQPGLSASFSLR